MISLSLEVQYTRKFNTSFRLRICREKLDFQESSGCGCGQVSQSAPENPHEILESDFQTCAQMSTKLQQKPGLRKPGSVVEVVDAENLSAMRRQTHSNIWCSEPTIIRVFSKQTRSKAVAMP